jgi:hypothetical protein
MENIAALASGDLDMVGTVIFSLEKQSIKYLTIA